MNQNRTRRVLSSVVVESLELRALLTAAPVVTVQNLVSNNTTTNPATNQDANLVNPWGLAAGAPTEWWAANEGTGTSTLYDGTGSPDSLVVNIPGASGTAKPTGTVYNGGSGFTVGTNEPAQFIFASLDGTISGWNASANPTASIVKVDNSAGAAEYTGLAIGTSGNNSFLYAADFHNNKIDVFDSNFQSTHLAGSFKDKKMTKGWAPFGIQEIGNMIYVTYAPQAKGAEREADGVGFGAVDVFHTDGSLLHRLIRPKVSNLNAPWGLAAAPKTYKAFAHDLLVGQLGDGTVQAYDPNTGEFINYLKKTNGKKVSIPGLWAIQFGNGQLAGATNQLFFTAGPEEYQDGVFGALSLGTKSTASSTGGGGGGIIYPMSTKSSGMFSATSIATSDILTGGVDPSTV
jgi:uncharacterized protein (TIGR03118 family)